MDADPEGPSERDVAPVAPPDLASAESNAVEPRAEDEFANDAAADAPAAEMPAARAMDPAMTQPASPASAAARDQPQATAATERPWPEDCEERRIFRAHGQTKSGDASKYRVAANAQYVVNFYFDSPWTDEVQLLAARPIVDNHAVVHHWVLWAMRNTGRSDGAIVGSPSELAPAHDPAVAPLIAAGAGSSDLEMPEGVGLGVGSADEIALMFDVHYVNLASGQVEEDASGVEVCVTHKKRPAEAALHELGKLSFELPAHARTDVSTTCWPSVASETVHIAGITPHMHRAGTHAKLVLNRRSGETLVVHDQEYVYDEQRTYMFSKENEIVLQPGDSLTTTCTFDNDGDAAIRAGSRNEDEMCRVFTLAWPAGALSNNDPFTAYAVSQPQQLGCMEF